MIRPVFKLKIFKRGTRLVYAASPWGKILYMALLGFMVWGFLTQSDPFSVAAVVLAIFCLLGVLYIEVWVFDRENNVVRSYFGIAPWVRRATYLFSDIQGLTIRHFTKGTPPAEEGGVPQGNTGAFGSASGKRRLGRRPMLTFAISLKSAAVVPIEIIEEGKSAGRTEADAKAIADYAGLALVIDRPSGGGPSLRISDIPRGFDKR